MCERQDGALEIYHDAKVSLDMKLKNKTITSGLYDTINLRINNIKDRINDSDYFTFQNEIYDALLMSECDKCLLPPSSDCDICNGTQNI